VQDGNLFWVTALRTPSGELEAHAAQIIRRSNAGMEMIASVKERPVSLERTYVLEKNELYYVDGGRLLRTTLPNATPGTISMLSHPIDIAIGDRYFYWLSNPSSEPGQWSSDLKRKLLTGGPVESVATNVDLLVGLLADPSNVYFNTQGSLVRVAHGSSITVPIIARPKDAHDRLMLVGAELVIGYEANVIGVPIAGGAPRTIVAGSGCWIDRMTADETHLYWTCNHGYRERHRILRLPISGGKPSVLVDNLGEVGGLAVDATNVYWLSDPRAIRTGLYAIPKGE